MKRPTPKEAQRASDHGQSDEMFGTMYPTILAYMMDDRWDDGKPREVSAISFTIKEGLWQLALNDKALKQSLYTSAATLEECLGLMEAALAGAIDSWRPWKRGKA